MRYRILNIALCFVFLCGIIPFTSAVSAASDGVITITTETANTGSDVAITISIKDSPGIMAMTISITYDSSALTYQSYTRGDLKDSSPMIADHPGKNLIRFVDCENRDFVGDGVLLRLKFKVKEDAAAGFYPISIAYSAGDFCNWELKRIMPTIVPGGVEVAYNGKNCTHKYGKWQPIAEAKCTTTGLQEHVCTVCGNKEISDIPALGHDYEDFWTVDTAATESEAGSMSRHCKRCDAVTDIISFGLTDADDNSFENKEGGTVPPSDFTGPLPDSSPDQAQAPQPDYGTPQNQDSAQDITEKKAEDLVSEIKKSEKAGSPLGRLTYYLFFNNGGLLRGAIKAFKNPVFLLLAVPFLILF